MNIAAVNTHKDYAADYWRYEVTVDGVVAVDCIFASESRGDALCLVCDERGIRQREFKPGELPGPVTKLLKGKVVIQRVSTPATERYSRHYINIFGKRHQIVSAQ